MGGSETHQVTDPHPKKVGKLTRKARLLAEEAGNEMGYWWLSFCDTSKPAGEQFVGGCIVRAPGFAHAVQASRALGCNPGGEIQGYGPSDGIAPNFPVGVLLSKAEWERLDKEIEEKGSVQGD